MKLSESYISMAVGLVVVVIIGLVFVNFLNHKSGKVSVPGIQAPEVEEKKEVSSSLPLTYTVSAGDSLWKVALKYYQSGYNWVSVAKANNIANPDILLVGQKLEIPKAEVIKPLAQAQPTGTAQISLSSYTVVEGDSLWKISVRIYGDGYQWIKLAKENAVINPDLIYPGQKLTIAK